MSDLLPTARKPRVSQVPGGVKKAALDKLDQLIIVTPASVPERIWKQLPEGRRLRALARRLGKDATIHSRLSNARTTGVVLGRLPKPANGATDPEPIRATGIRGQTHGGRAAGKSPQRRPDDRRQSSPEQAEAIARAVTLAALAHSFRLPSFRKKPPPASKLGSLRSARAGGAHRSRSRIGRGGCHQPRTLADGPAGQQARRQRGIATS